MRNAGEAGRAGHGRLYLAAGLAVAYIVLAQIQSAPAAGQRQAMAGASRLMARATEAIRDCREGRGLGPDPAADPNATGLVGLEASPITTSHGVLEAKRTTANPEFAALVASLLAEAGAKRGDVVAVGASSSFPALIVATLAAAEALGLEPLVISSLGASEYGANRPDFHWMDMEDCLRAAGVLDVRPVARAVGGEGDVGLDMDAAGRDLLASRIRAGAVPFLEEPDLARNVSARLALYRRAAAGRPIRAFVNIGGSTANIGSDASVLSLAPGLSRTVPLPPPDRRGVLQAMAAEGVPVVHLLNVKGLCERYGLPWDPRPLPAPGSARRLYRRPAGRSAAAAGLDAAFILAMSAWLLASRRRSL